MMLSRSKYLLNIFRKDTARLLSHRSFEEVKIPVPWGYIAGKWWAPHDKRPILAFHDWQENADSFNRLIPYLPDHLGILALDLPGHGLSTHLPEGCCYYSVDNILLYKRIIRYFNWDAVSLMGHSLGAFTSLLYTIMYPDEVDMLICLDGLYFYSESCKPDKMSKRIDNFLKLDSIKSKGAPCYTLEELTERLHLGSGRSLNSEFTADMLQRNAAPAKNHPGKFYITRDVRLKTADILQCPRAMIVEGAERIQRCPMFVSIGTQGKFYANQVDNMREMLNIYKKHNKHCYFYELDGTHHLHVNNPEILSGPLNEFLSKHCTNVS